MFSFKGEHKYKYMRGVSTILGVCLLFSGTSNSQTTLSAGDVAITTLQSDGNKDFSFVLLTSIASGTEIKFTDDAWHPVGDSLRGSEGTVTWTAASALEKGIEITISESNNTSNISSNYGSVTRSGSFTLSASGDQIHVYQGSDSSPTFIYSFNYDATGFVLTDNDNTGDTGLPNGLTENTNALSVSPHRDNWQYNCPTITNATSAIILASIVNGSNYNSSDTNLYDPIGCNYRDVTISGNAGWRLLSLPVSGSTIEAISDDTPIQGIAGGIDASADANFYIYDDSGAWEEPTNYSTAWGDGFGFALYFYDNTSNGSNELPISIDATGLEPSSDVIINLNKSTTTGGLNHYFTLAGNPFASNYNLNSITQSGTGLQDNVHFWDDGAGSYDPEDRTANSGLIAATWQGFWVEIANTGTSTTITIPTTGRTSNDTTKTFFSKAVSNQGDISFTLTSQNTVDKAIRLAFRDYASKDVDRADASKLVPLVSTYATMAFATNNMLKSVESLPYHLEEEITIPLTITTVGISEEFSFAWTGLETIPAEWQITLHDYEMETSINMRDLNQYVFTEIADVQAKVNPLSTLKGPAAVSMKAKAEPHRFGITISPTSVSNELDENPKSFSLSQNYPNPFNPTTTINYTIEENGDVNISIYNLMGQKVATLVNEQKSAGQYNVRWDASRLSSGMYYYRLDANGQSITRKMTLIK